MATGVACGCYRRWPGSSFPLVRLGELASIGLADAHPAVRFQLRRGPGLDHRQPRHRVPVGGRRPCPLAGQPGREPVHQRAELERPDAAYRRNARLPTPAQNATKELLPHLPNGHQVILSGLGHAEDFWSYEPSASTQLLTTFYATGQVDTSRYTPNKVSFTTSSRQPAEPKDILGQ